jgi:hypothetical protein
MVWDLYGSGAGVDIPVVSQIPEVSATYTVPPNHFSGATSHITVIPDTQSVGPSSTFSLQMAHSTMVPHVTTIPTGNVVVSQAPIGTPLSSRPIMSLPPGYHALNPSTAIPTQVPSRVSGLFVPPGYNVATGFVPTPSQVLSGGSYPPFPGGSGPSGSNPIGSTHHPFTSGYQIPIGGKSNVGGYPPLGGQPQVGLYNPLYGHNTSGSLAHLWNLLAQGNPQSSGGNSLKETLLYPLTRASHIWVLWVPLGVHTFSLVSLFKGTFPTNPTLWATCLHILGRICQDTPRTCRLLTVLLVYR